MSTIKTYAYKGITIDAVQITTHRMSEADRTAINAWLDKNDVSVTIDTQYTYGVEMVTAISVETPDYAFYMTPGDWLAHDGDTFFHISDKVFRKHYREVNDEEDPVVYATGMYQFIPPAWRTDKPRKPRGGATMKAAYLDEVEAISSDLRARHRAKGLATSTCPYPRPKIITGGKVHQPFIDAIRKARDKDNADADAEAFKQVLATIERKQQAKETNQETYRRHLKLLDLDGHADHCTYCKDTTRNAIPPVYNKALADAVDQQLAGMANRRKYAHLHMDRDGKITPAHHLREELEQQWAPTHTTKTTPRKCADEWRPSLEVMAMYYNQFITEANTMTKGEADRHLHGVPGSGSIRLHNGIAVTTKDGTRAYVHAKELTRLSNGDIEITGPRFTVGYTAEAYISFNYLNAYGVIRTVTSPAQGRKETEGVGEKEREADEQGVFDAHRDSVRSCLDAIWQLSDGNSAIQALVRQADNSLTSMRRTTTAPTIGPEATND